MIVCKNCGGAVSEIYCSSCGQKHVDDRLTLSLLSEEAQILFSRLLKQTWETALHFIRSPSNMVNNYFMGRRRTYQEPLSYMVVALSVFFVLSAISRKFFNIPSGVFQLGSLPTILAATALLALMFHVLAVYPKRNLVETLVTALFLYGTTFWIFSAFFILQIVLTPIFQAAGLVWLPWAQPAFFLSVSGLALLEIAIAWRISWLRIVIAASTSVLVFLTYQQVVEKSLCERHLPVLCRQ